MHFLLPHFQRPLKATPMQITARPIAADAWAYFKLLTNTVENVSWMYFVDIIFAINARKFRNCA